MERPFTKQAMILLAGICIAWSALAVETDLASSNWLPLTRDDIHDPNGPGVQLLQNPSEALRDMPSDVVGNKVNWMRALDRGHINPRENLYSNKKNNVLDMDVLRQNTGEMNAVLFPHRQHTEWLDCTNCHEWLFKSKARATKFSMFDILKGEFCGRCHGAVAFPLTQCNRCHSVPHSTISSSATAD